MKAMKLAVFLGGPHHGAMQWVETLEESRGLERIDARKGHTDFVPLDPSEDPQDAQEPYRLAFADEYIGIYYWRLNEFQVKAVRQQVQELRARHGETHS